MKKTAIIIPSRLEAKRFPNKPLKRINNIPMILHVINRAKESKIGEVIVATPDDEIFNIVNNSGGKAILTNNNHSSGSDRIYEVYLKQLKDKADIIINLQGDMPNIKPDCIKKLENFMRRNSCEIGTMASAISNKNELINPNIVKVIVKKDLQNNDFLIAEDFFRVKKDINNKKIYHHIGIYAFTNMALTKYINLKRSKLEIERNLEQMRALENNFVIKVGLCNSSPLSVDTKEDLLKVEREMN